jgi:hypothetical protein
MHRGTTKLQSMVTAAALNPRWYGPARLLDTAGFGTQFASPNNRRQAKLQILQ